VKLATHLHGRAIQENRSYGRNVSNLPVAFSMDTPLHFRNRVSSVDITTGYGLKDRGVGVRVPIGARCFSTPRRPDRLWGSFLGDKAAGA
jgi:hypothetical protein